jgi:hypothetical protein
MRRSILLLLLSAVASAPAHATVTVHAGDSVNMFGDSITVGIGTGGPYYTPWANGINAVYNSSGPQTASLITSTTPVTASLHTGIAVTVQAPTFRGPLVLTAKGVTGNKLSDLIARVNTDVIALAPKIVIVEECVNDVIAGTALGTFTSQAATLMSDITTGIPGVQVAWVSCLSYGESYPDTNWGSTINSYNAVIQSAVTAAGGTYVDVRTPQQTYESIHNTPPPGALGGILCSDTPGIHPNPTGVTLMSTALTAVTTITTP